VPTLAVQVELVLASGRLVHRRLAPSAPGRVVSDDPVAYAERLAASGAGAFLVTDLDGIAAESPAQLDVASRVAAATRARVAYRGGVMTAADVARVRGDGFDTVVVDRAAFGDPAVLRWAVDELGDRLAVALDADGDRVRFPDATAHLSLVDAVAELSYRGVRNVFYTDVGRAGTLRGPNLDGIVRVCDAASGSVAYGGGVASADDLRALAALPCPGLHAVVIGTALYEQRLALQDALAALAGASATEEKT
jgi:phosphoribosylformimino-5-aminoimidazole carboxamide ribotide isomerase